MYVIQNDGQLVEMIEQPYDSEALLQELIEKYPNLLAGEQINRAEPRRWLLVAREMPVPSEEDGVNRWSVDHLFLDQDAIPTFVEVKRSSDTRIRREVVGQMLDYAANGTAYWSVEVIRSEFIINCQTKGLKPEEVLESFLEKNIEVEQFWQTLKTNLQVGKVRMLFVADSIPEELQRIVEFLNFQMASTEVLAIEIKQFIGSDLRTLVPRVIGQTIEAQQLKNSSKLIVQQWTKNTFIQEIQAKYGEKQVEVIEAIIDWTNKTGISVRWGKGLKYGSLILNLVGKGEKYKLFTVWTSGSIEVNLQYPGLMRFIGGIISEKLSSYDLRGSSYGTYLNIPIAVLESDSNFQKFLSVFERIIEEIRSRDELPEIEESLSLND